MILSNWIQPPTGVLKADIGHLTRKFLMRIIETISRLGFKVVLEDERLAHILIRHPEVSSEVARLKEVLADPDFVRKSRKIENFFLFYKFYPKTSVTQKYLVAGVKLNHEGEIRTSYLTDRIKIGDEIWRKR